MLEQHGLLSALRTWKEAATTRAVVLLGGDVHLGGEMEIACGASRPGWSLRRRAGAGRVQDRDISGVDSRYAKDRLEFARPGS